MCHRSDGPMPSLRVNKIGRKGGGVGLDSALKKSFLRPNICRSCKNMALAAFGLNDMI